MQTIPSSTGCSQNILELYKVVRQKEHVPQKNPIRFSSQYTLFLFTLF